MFVLHLNRGMSYTLYAESLGEIGPEAEKVCRQFKCGGTVHDHDQSPSVQVGGVGRDGTEDGALRYMEFSHE